jgi:hypothetical protein
MKGMVKHLIASIKEVEKEISKETFNDLIPISFITDTDINNRNRLFLSAAIKSTEK